MLELCKSGAYSDLTLIFNGKEYKLHSVLLGKVSKYFKCINKNIFREKDKIELNFKQIDNELLDTKYLDCFIENIYDGKFDTTIFESSSIIDIIEYYRLLDYLQFEGTADYKLDNLITNKLDKCIPKYNDMDEMFKIYCEKYNINKICNVYYQSSFSPQYCQDPIIMKICCSRGHSIITNLQEPSYFGLGVNFYETDNKITYNYVEYLFQMISDEKYRNIILGISNLDLNDIDKFDAKYHKYILQVITSKLN